MKFSKWLFAPIIFFVCAGVAVSGNWHHWRGEHRNDISDESSGWSADGWISDTPVWSISVGVGSCSPIIWSNRLYTMGWQDGRDFVYCLNAMTGEEIWRQSYPAPKYGRYAEGDKNLYAGPSSTPEYDPETGLLYTLGNDGELRCWDTKNGGKLVWRRNLYDEYAVPQRPRLTKAGLRDYGYTTSPIIHHDWLIVEVGDDEGNLMAFDKRSGERKWVSENKDPAGHTGGPALITVDGVPCLAVLTLKNLIVVRLDDGYEGKTVCEYPWITDYANNIASPAVSGNFVIITSGYNQNAMVKLEITMSGATEVWRKKYVSKVCTPIIHDGYLYWAWRKLHCVDFETGDLVWEGGNHGDAGSCILTSDDRLIVWSDTGTLALVDTHAHSPDEYRELATIKKVFQTQVWPHVALSNGYIYCKDRDGNLACFKTGR